MNEPTCHGADADSARLFRAGRGHNKTRLPGPTGLGGRRSTGAGLRTAADVLIAALVLIAAGMSLPGQAFGNDVVPILPEETEGCINVQTARQANAVVDCAWPTTWQVFGPLKPGFTRIPASELAVIPATIKVDGVHYSPIPVEAKGLEVNLMFLRPKDAKTVPLAAYCFGEFDAPVDGTLYVNFSADWKMAWCIDGREVCSTMAHGNQARTKQWHRRGFAVPVAKGRHTVAVLCQRHRWDWHFLSVAGVGAKPPEAMQEFFQLRRKVTMEEETSLITEDRTLEPAPPVTETEAGALIKKTKAPSRFRNYKPEFRIEEYWTLHETSFTKQHFIKKRGYNIYDGDRLVAGGSPFGIHIKEMNPLEPWNIPPSDKRGYRYVNFSIGKTFAGTGSKEGARYCISPDKSTITFAHDAPCPTNHPSAWTRNSVVVTLRVDPVCGYVVDVLPEFEAEAPLNFLEFKDGWAYHEYFNVMPSHLYYTLTKPVMDWRYEYTMYSNRFTDKYRGWVTDEPKCQASDNHEGRLFKCQGLPYRDGGIIAFSKDPQGWSLASARRIVHGKDRVKFYNMTCHLLQDQHCQFQMKRPLPGETVRLCLPFRMMNLPPEVTDYLLDRVELYLGDFIMVRQGQERDFENESRLENECSPWSPGVTLAADVGRSGKRSAVFRNDDRRKRSRSTSQRIDILPKMEYGREYQLEGWAKVEGEGSTARFRVLPPFMDDKYWQGPKLKPIDGEAVEASPKWQKISLRFRNHDWHGWSLQPTVHAELPVGGAVYIDDLRVSRVPN